MKTKKTPPSSFSIELPENWNALTVGEYRYILLLLSIGFTPERAALSFTIRRIPEAIRRKIGPKKIAAAAETMNFLSTPPADPARRLPHIIDETVTAVHPLLANLPFGKYLILENYYQGYIQTLDDSALRLCARILYPALEDLPDDTLGSIDRLAVIHWLYALKTAYARLFPHLFKPARKDTPPTAREMQDQMNAQLRALTLGDITKEEQVKQIDTYRALTELDAKAREAEETLKKL